MEDTIWAYQIASGADDVMYFEENEAHYRRAAIEQRAGLKEGDLEDHEDLGTIALSCSAR